MIDIIHLNAGETAVVDTTNNTAVVAVGSADGAIAVMDSAGNTIATITYGETMTLPYGSGKYTLAYNTNATYKALVMVAHYFAV